MPLLNRPNVREMMDAYGSQPNSGMKPAYIAGYPAQTDEEFMGNVGDNTLRTLGLLGPTAPPESYVQVDPSLGLTPPSPAMIARQRAARQRGRTR